MDRTGDPRDDSVSDLLGDREQSDDDSHPEIKHVRAAEPSAPPSEGDGKT
jgi:hypothetical protein